MYTLLSLTLLHVADRPEPPGRCVWLDSRHISDAGVSGRHWGNMAAALPCGWPHPSRHGDHLQHQEFRWLKVLDGERHYCWELSTEKAVFDALYMFFRCHCCDSAPGCGLHLGFYLCPWTKLILAEVTFYRHRYFIDFIQLDTYR